METTHREDADQTFLCRRHLWFGWLGLLIFLTLGIVLETLHGLKSDYYLDPRNATRRLMWTLAHTHGTLFSLINIAFAVSVKHFFAGRTRLLSVASACLMAGMITLPLGFLLGGVWLYGGDPGPGVFLVPPGALIMLVGVGAVAVQIWRDRQISGGPRDQSSNRKPTSSKRERGQG